jgi:putative membrane protein
MANFLCFFKYLKEREQMERKRRKNVRRWQHAGALAWIGTSSLFLHKVAFAQTRPYDDHHMGSWIMDGWGMGWFGGILMVIIAVLVIIGAVYLIKWIANSSRNQSRPESRQAASALDILKERYARGEIDKQEFETQKSDLTA